MAGTVANIMERDAPTIPPKAGVEEVVQMFREQDVSVLPVVNAAGRCVGVITEDDLVIADEEGDLHLPHFIELFGGIVYLEPLRRFDDRLKKASAAVAEDLMTRDPVTVPPDASVHEAAHKLAEVDHSRLPVVEHGRYQGIVTRADVLTALATER